MIKKILLFYLILITGCVGKNWDKKIDINNKHSKIKAIALDAKGDLYIVGDGKYLISKSSQFDWWIKKFESDGEEVPIWDKRFDGNNSSDIPYAIGIDNNENVFVVGHGFNLINSSSRFDWWLKKIDANGHENLKNWNKKIDAHNGGKIAKASSDKIIEGFSDDGAVAIIIDSENAVFIAGDGENLVDNLSGSDWWIKKFDQNGNEDLKDWNKKIDGYKGNDAISSMAIDKNDNIYVVGWGIHPVHRMFWWIKKFKTDGTEDTKQWDKRIFWQTEKSSIQYAHAVAVDSNNNIYVVGSGHNLVSDTSEFDWWIKKFSPDGKEDTTHWNKKFDGTERDQGKSGDDDEALAIAIDSQNNVYVAGYGTNLISPTSSRDWWIKKFDQNGNEDKSWEKRIDGNGKRDVARSIAIDKHDNVYVGGFGTNIVSEESRADWWIMKFGK